MPTLVPRALLAALSLTLFGLGGAALAAEPAPGPVRVIRLKPQRIAGQAPRPQVVFVLPRTTPLRQLEDIQRRHLGPLSPGQPADR